MKNRTNPHMKSAATALLLTLAPLPALAATTAPGAGSILQQIKPATPPAPSPTGTGLTIEREGAGELPSSAPFLVTRIQITGNTLFDTQTLHALVSDAEGKSVSLSELNNLAARITSYYQNKGYPLARAIIPAQVIRDGVVVIQVIEARYGKINLDNRSRAKDPLLLATLSPLQSGQAISQPQLDRSLLLLSDIPGVGVNAVLRPGEAVGTSDLRVETQSQPAVAGSAVLDNYGDRYTGRARLGLTANIFNPLRRGDMLSLNALSSDGEMTYGRASYEYFLNGMGTRLGAAYSALRYDLGESLSTLDAHGTARVGSLWTMHPIVRSRTFNLYGQIRYDWLDLRDRVDASDIRTDRHLGNGTVGLTGDARDRLRGINTWSVAWTTGQVDFDDPAAQLADAATANTQGKFSKWNATLSRLQGLNPKSALYLALTGQWANDNLDSAQKMVVGGPYTVRAYDTGAMSGDSGYLGTAEFRYDLGSAWNGQWQMSAFVDSAHVEVNENPWAVQENSATLSGAGFGVSWRGAKRWSARAHVATPIGSESALADSTKSARGWAEVGMVF